MCEGGKRGEVEFFLDALHVGGQGIPWCWFPATPLLSQTAHTFIHTWLFMMRSMLALQPNLLVTSAHGESVSLEHWGRRAGLQHPIVWTRSGSKLHTNTSQPM